MVEVPSLPGCITQGKTIEEALNNAREAIECHIEALEKSKIPILYDTSELVIAQV
ncbi:type II toxin-antitoxin system HicB family antitoxin [Candidatus Woesearchaeota archaeon]|nr:type II toxin-antitoxin system HicB family antitoxin [Candidatus Woesearchaeota archaeon]